MFTKSDNDIFDQILENRRICRKFTDKVPSKEDISAIIEAGRLAPYASISSGDVDVFRHFFVLLKDDPRMERIDQLIRSQSAIDLEGLQKEMKTDSFLEQHGQGLANMWGHVAKDGLPVFPNPPCLIIMAEWRGARRAERQSLAHTLENMWLKATALNLDFNMISPIESMVDNQEFCDIFGLPAGKYGWHGCIVGYKAAEKLTSKPITAQVHWM